MTNYVEQSLSWEVDCLVAVLFSNLTVEIVAPKSHLRARKLYVFHIWRLSILSATSWCAVVASDLCNTSNEISRFF
jgi:hypothetical protein